MIVSLCAISSSRATLLFSDNFDSYSNGALVGQGPWLQTSTVTTAPVQVTSGQAVLGTTGQDVYAPFASTYSIPVGTTLDIGLDLTVASAQATGDYFLHTTPTVGNSSLFFDRLFVKSSGTGFELGYAGTSGAAVVYGTSVLSLNTDYRIVLVYNDVSGLANDTASIYVNPTDSTLESDNTAYLSNVAWGAGAAETNTVSAINLRQGSSTAAAGLSVDNLDVGTTFGDVSAVPEPSTLALLGYWLRRGDFLLYPPQKVIGSPLSDFLNSTFSPARSRAENAFSLSRS